MSNNSNLSLRAKNISQYATIGSAFLGGLVGFFIGKSIGPSEPESETETVTKSETISEEESKPIIESSEPIALSSSSLPAGQTMGFVPISTDAKEAQQAVLAEPSITEPNVEVEPEVNVKKDQVFPSINLAEAEEKPVELAAPVAPTAEPLASLEPTINTNANPNQIQGGKMRSTRRKPRKPRQRSSRKYGGQAFGAVIPPTS